MNGLDVLASIAALCQRLSEHEDGLRQIGLFNSEEYGNRSRTNQEFVTDLYAAYLLREPDQAGYDFWLSVLVNDNNQGIDGRAHLIRAFAESTEFANLIGGLVGTP